MSVWLPQLCKTLPKRLISFPPQPEYWAGNCMSEAQWTAGRRVTKSQHGIKQTDTYPTDCFTDTIRKPTCKLPAMPHLLVPRTGSWTPQCPEHLVLMPALTLWPALYAYSWGQGGKRESLQTISEHVQKVGPNLQCWEKAQGSASASP